MIHCIMVTKNEAHRYVEASLLWNRSVFDSITVVDDWSTDGTFDIAATHADNVLLANASFERHEGLFREEAWKQWLEVIYPSPADWLVSIDADEFVVGDLSGALKEVGGRVGAFTVREGWGVDPIVIRVDGWWGRGKSPRCVMASEVLSGVKFANKHMASGSLPNVKGSAPILLGVELLHLGYATEQDRETKFKRYSSTRGHSRNHVASIKRDPTLVVWEGPEVL